MHIVAYGGGRHYERKRDAVRPPTCRNLGAEAVVASAQGMDRAAPRTAEECVSEARSPSSLRPNAAARQGEAKGPVSHLVPDAGAPQMPTPPQESPQQAPPAQLQQNAQAPQAAPHTSMQSKPNAPPHNTSAAEQGPPKALPQQTSAAQEHPPTAPLQHTLAA